MQSHPNPFCYDQLPAGHIRLCILPPGGADLYLYGTLIDVDIASCGIGIKYNALSYTWGDATQTSYIRLRIGKRVGHLRITRSMIDALEHVRQKDHQMAFWVDQICIDQMSVEEKESQIKLMKLIYERASSVYAWIGKADPDSNLAMDTLKSGAWRHILPVVSETPPNANIGNEGTGQASLNLENCDQGRLSLAIADLLRRPWWKRVWIMQEASAQTAVQTMVCCGDKQLELSRFFDFVSIVQHQLLSRDWDAQDALTVFYKITHLPKLKAFAQKRRMFPLRPFLELLENARDTEATDSRDKVYVMLAFAHETSIPGHSLRADYLQLPEETYVEFALWHIHQTQCLDILSHCSIDKVAFTDVVSEGRILTRVGQNDLTGSNRGTNTREWYNPSWVPDWRRTLPFNTIVKRQNPDDPSSMSLFNATGTTHLDFKIPAKDRGLVMKLKMRGLKIARVKLVQDEGPSENILWEAARLEHKCPITHRFLREIYIRNLYTDLKGHQVEDEKIVWHRANDIEELSWPVSPSTVEPHDIPDTVVMRRHTDGRCLYHTEPAASEGFHGIFGLGPRQMRAGDELWVLEGANTPFIIRPRTIEWDTNNPTLDLNSGSVEMKLYKANQDQVFKIVGETFVFGLMDGYVAEIVILFTKLQDLMDEALCLLEQMKDSTSDGTGPKDRIDDGIILQAPGVEARYQKILGEMTTLLTSLKQPLSTTMRDVVMKATGLVARAIGVVKSMDNVATKLAGVKSYRELKLWDLPGMEHRFRDLVLT